MQIRDGIALFGAGVLAPCKIKLQHCYEREVSLVLKKVQVDRVRAQAVESQEQAGRCGARTQTSSSKRTQCYALMTHLALKGKL